MEFKQYTDRENTPLRWHRFRNALNIVSAVFCVLLSVIFLVEDFNSVLTDAVKNIYEMSFPDSSDLGLLLAFYGFIISMVLAAATSYRAASIAVGILLLIHAAFLVAVFFFGRKFKKIYLILVVIDIIYTLVSHLATLIDSFSAGNLIVFVLIMVYCGCNGLYYYKRWPLFAENYGKTPVKNSTESSNEINYDALNQR